MDQQLKLAEEEAQEYQAYLHKLDQETEDDNQVGVLLFGYNYGEILSLTISIS